VAVTESATGRCAAMWRRTAQPMSGTAPRSNGFLLVTDPGPWAAAPFTAHRRDPGAASEIAARAGTQGLKPLLIRRHGRQSSTRRYGLFDSTTNRAQWWPYEDLGDIARAAWRFSEPPAATVEPVYLVCTHGSRDACCAIDGRPVAGELNRLRRDAAWESSHLGGHRFAANVLVLPFGLYYAAVSPSDVAELVAATDAGILLPRLLRGRSTEPSAVQAARTAAAAHTGQLGIDDLQLISVSQVDQQWTIQFSGPVRSVTVLVRRTESPIVASCGKPPEPEVLWHPEVSE